MNLTNYIKNLDKLNKDDLEDVINQAMRLIQKIEEKEPMLVWSVEYSNSDHINQMITLTVITLSGFHCTIEYID